jgi:hypothetical protein
MRILILNLVFSAFLFSFFYSKYGFSQGYYKDLFMDSGVGCAHYTDLPAADVLNLSYEYVATGSITVQNNVMLSNQHDENGVLIYPDGAPRFRVIYTNGRPDKKVSIESIVENVRSFYNKGGSYTGSCLGAMRSGRAYYNLYPAGMFSTGLPLTFTGHFIPVDSPILIYHDFGGDYYIANIWHHEGQYITDTGMPTGTEPLLKYDYPPLPMHNNISTWAYKKNEHSGRVVVTGSHPERVISGEGLELMKAILLYALDGFGTPAVKAELTNGLVRVMDKSTSDNDPDFAKIGDKQYHHFKIRILPGTDSLTVTLDGDDTQPFNLYIKKDSLAFRNTADYADTSAGADKIIHIPDITTGYWYISVECDTTIDVIPHSWGYEYTGNLAVLNGIPYSILAEWYDPNAHPLNTTINSKFVKANSDTLLINTKLFNPYNHNVQLNAVITSIDSVLTDSFPMYDDGNHGDSLAGDGFYGGFISPVTYENEFWAGIHITDLDSNYQNLFNNLCYFTSIGPLEVEDMYFYGSDSIPNHGDNLKCKLILRNTGLMTTAENVSAELTVLDTCAEITIVLNPTFGNIASDTTAMMNGNYRIKFFNVSLDSIYVHFKVDIASNDFVWWRDTISVFVFKDPDAINLKDDIFPKKFTLKQNYPNPFNPNTTIEFSLPKTDFVTLKVYNILGQEAITLISKKLIPGNYKYVWNASTFASGVYYYRLKTDQGYEQSRKLLLMK